ncbi:hypothetical protein CFB40_35795 [Burkholderia sp. AU31652]|uniref:hypothetical protein n=1 Tax=Burkholderia sp. AU31652 TaxID=2015354 RepID=UPI000B7AB928|nr:hypothetical protein [Burkholderia sp. AU31652]OXI78247.1 hypothetical protein CFB40_35795 [Burkholderia sp. AU31652]
MLQQSKCIRRWAWTMCAGLSLSGAARAADNCQMHAGHAQLDYGAQYRQTILGQPASARGYSLGKRLVSVSIVCKEPVRMAIFLRGDALDDGAFRFGQQGVLSVTAGDANLDGKSVALGRVEHAGQQPSEPAGKVGLRPGSGIVVLAQGVPAAGSRLTLQLELEPVIPRSAIEVLNNESHWSSSHAVELVPF